MLKFIIVLIASIYITSTLFMLYYFINAQLVTYKRDGHFFKMPWTTFFIVHLCPIIHTMKVFAIMRKFRELQQKRGL